MKQFLPNTLLPSRSAGSAAGKAAKLQLVLDAFRALELPGLDSVCKITGCLEQCGLDGIADGLGTQRPSAEQQQRLTLSACIPGVNSWSRNFHPDFHAKCRSGCPLALADQGCESN